MATKKKGHQKNTSQSNGDRDGAAIMRVSPKQIGIAVASAIVGEVLQAATQALVTKASQSNSGPGSALKHTVQDSLAPINNPVKQAVDAVKHVVTDAISPVQTAIGTVEEGADDGIATLTEVTNNGKDTFGDTVEESQAMAKHKTGNTIEALKEAAKDTQEGVVDRIDDATHKTQQAVGDVVDTAQTTSDVTRQAIAEVIENTVERVKTILADATLQEAPTKGKKGKKNKKNKKGKK